MIAAHTPVIIRIMRPNRQHLKHTLIIVSHHGGDNICIAGWINEIQQRMKRSKGIP